MCSFLDSWSVEVQTELLQINIVVKNVQFIKLELSAKKKPKKFRLYFCSYRNNLNCNRKHFAWLN